MPDCFIQLMGGLGNQMFQIATAYAHAKRNGYNLCLSHTTHGGRPTYWDRILHNCRQYIRNPVGSPNRYSEPHFHYSMIPASTTNIFGYFQSSKYFSEFRDEIRTLFTSPASIIAAVDTKYRDIVSPHAVAVHVRRGDYLTGINPDIHFVTANAYFGF